MTNIYHYFESGEISEERLLIECELLKRLQDMNLLRNLSWNEYDTSALKRFEQYGIDEASKALIERQKKTSFKRFKQYNFVKECRYFPSNIKQFSRLSKSFVYIFNIFFILLSFCSVLGFYLYQYFYFNHQHYLITTLYQPLTTKKRHLSLTDDLSIILLTFTIALIVCSIINSERYHRIFILLLLLLLIFLLIQTHQILTFLSTYRD